MVVVFFRLNVAVFSEGSFSPRTLGKHTRIYSMISLNGAYFYKCFGYTQRLGCKPLYVEQGKKNI